VVHHVAGLQVPRLPLLKLLEEDELELEDWFGLNSAVK
jgi:hypothetical protein